MIPYSLPPSSWRTKAMYLIAFLLLPLFLFAEDSSFLPKDTLPGRMLPDTTALRITQGTLPDSLVKQAGQRVLGDTVPTDVTEATSRIATSTRKAKNSKAALLWSIIPGGGQVYNEAYWKIPIVIGIYTACTYAITWNNAALVEYQNAYRDILSDKPLENKSWQDFLPPGVDPQSYITNSTFQEQLRRGRDFYRRYRDLSIIVTVGMYFFIALDAYVDAELSTFDISPNLALEASPAVIAPKKEIAPYSKAQSPGLGVSLALRF